MRQALTVGDLAIAGQLVDASNMTLLASVGQTQCIYKPVRGETPLWDFPSATLGRREVATFELSTLFPHSLVPLTVWRSDGPYGPGMCQEFVSVDENVQLTVDVVPAGEIPTGFIEILQALDGHGQPVSLIHQDRQDLRWLALFDAVANNADRKGGHILHGTDQIWGIDHGVTFHAEPKLRTVLWGWAGSPLLADELDVLISVREQLNDVLGPWISAEEVAACQQRIDGLLTSGTMPIPSTSWPSIPWPVF